MIASNENILQENKERERSLSESIESFRYRIQCLREEVTMRP